MEALAVVVVLALVAAAPATAQSYPGERPWTGPAADTAYAAADAYWTDERLPGPRPALLLADSLCDVDGRCPMGRGGLGTIWLHSDALGYSAEKLQRLVTHELGHVRGLGHSSDPLSIMSEGFETERYAEVAIVCAPEWTRATKRIGRMWRGGHRRAARRTFRGWARRHPARADWLRYAGVLCTA